MSIKSHFSLSVLHYTRNNIILSSVFDKLFHRFLLLVSLKYINYSFNFLKVWTWAIVRPIKKVQQNWKISYIVCTGVMQLCGLESSGRSGLAGWGPQYLLSVCPLPRIQMIYVHVKLTEFYFVKLTSLNFTKPSLSAPKNIKSVMLADAFCHVVRMQMDELYCHCHICSSTPDWNNPITTQASFLLLEISWHGGVHRILINGSLQGCG